MSEGLPLLAIVGPTASGKTELADCLAQRLSSAVISIDAMQVYRGMDIGTAKLPVGERRAPLLMVDVAKVDEDYSVQLFQKDARAAIDTILACGNTPVLCGGTGLYLNAVIDDMRFPTGEREGDARQHYETLAEKLGAEGLHAHLQERDPKSAALIHPNNVRRVVRALEMLDEGVSYAAHHAGLKNRGVWYETRIWGLECERETLYERINTRVDHMYDAGLVEEIVGLIDMGLTAHSTAGQAIGYQEVMQLIDGVLSEEEARKLTKRRTRRYAKRQFSWFKHDPRVRWIDVAAMGLEAAIAMIEKDLKHAREEL